MVKVVSFRFQPCLIRFTMLLVEGSSEMQLFRYLTNNIFRNPQFQNYISYEGHLFLKVFKILSPFYRNAAKNWEKGFSFLDNCIWIGCRNLSLIREENLWPAVNVFTNSSKNMYITKRDFFQLNFLHIDQ